MQKQTNNHHRSHHVRLSAVAIALATGFHIAGLGHVYGREQRHEVASNFGRALIMYNLERENETARHAVRFDEGLRLPSISGGLI